MREQVTDVEVPRGRLKQLLLSFCTGLVILAGILLGSRETWSARHFSHGAGSPRIFLLSRLAVAVFFQYP